MKQTDYKKNIRRVFWVWFILFASLIIWIINYAFIEAKGVVINPYNRRINLVSERVVRGDITDTGGDILARTEGDNRVYPYGAAMAHIVGFTGTNGIGAERRYALPLLTVNGELMARINAAAYNEPVIGNTLVTTLDAGLNKLAYELLSGNKGSIIAIEPHTGKILAMVSNPAFDPNHITENYGGLANDDNNPLMNRAARGLYPPGSVYKIITLTAAMRYMPGYETYTYECPGSISVDGRNLRCYNETAHGSVDLYSAFAVSCNGYFIELAEQVGAQNLYSTAQAFLFNAALPYPLEYSRSSHVLPTTRAELAETAIGQGKTLATPLHIALITSAIAGGGILYEPYITDSIKDTNGRIVTRYYRNAAGAYFLPEEAEILTKAMRLAVTDGTAARMGTDYNIAAKTGSAQNPHGTEHGWVTAFAPYDDPRICVVVMLENCGGSAVLLEPAARLIAAYLGGD